MTETRPQSIVRAIKETMTVVISGPPGAGKSTLLRHIAVMLNENHFIYKVDWETHRIFVRLNKQAFPEGNPEEVEE